MNDAVRTNDIDSMTRNLNQILAQLEYAKQEIERKLEWVKDDAEGTQFVNIAASVQKTIIAIPASCQTHYLTQLAHKLDS